MAVSDETLILAEESDSSASYQEMIQSIIDAKQKDVERYTDQNAAFASLSKHLSEENRLVGGEPKATVFIGFFPLSQIDGASLTIEDEHSQLTRAYVFNDGSDNVSSVKEYERENASNVSDGVSFSREENVLIAEISVSTGEVAVDHVINAFGTS